MLSTSDQIPLPEKKKKRKINIDEKRERKRETVMLNRGVLCKGDGIKYPLFLL